MTHMQSDSHASLLAIATDLCAHLAAEDRYRRVLDAVRQVVPCDAASLLRLDDSVLVPVSTFALQPQILGIRFHPAEHPRLAALLTAPGPLRFTGANLPDPFDGLLEAHPDALSRVHACMGAPLRIEGRVVGVLTVDALDPHAFDGVDEAELALFAELAAAAIRTAGLIEALEHTAAHQGMVTRQLVREARQRGGEIVGRSPAIQHLQEEVELLAGSDLTVLITGETGTGKELVAHAIHATSARATAPIVQVNCAALPESIAESELFGHTRGAFTGASEARAGRFEVADGGTLLLDEVGELPVSIQAKLLRVLQSGEVQRVGSDARIQVDVRVLAATNRDLAVEVREGRFRADLYHRLAVYPLHVPPLRERDGDVAILAGFFLDQARVRLGLGPARLAPAARTVLERYSWPGNVRELEHLLLRAALRAAGGRRREVVVVEAEHLDLPGAANRPTPQPATRAETSLREALDTHARTLIGRPWPTATAFGPRPPAGSRSTAATWCAPRSGWGCASSPVASTGHDAPMTDPTPPRRLVALVAVLYLGSGLPMGVVGELVPVWLKVHGTSLEAIGLVTLVGIPWTLKPLWAPAVDGIGRLMGWATTALIGVALGVAMLPWLGIGRAFWAVLVTVAACSATVDLAADGWTATVVPEHQQGRINGVRVAAYRVAMLLAGGGSVALGAWLPWPAVFGLVSLGALLLALPLLLFPRPERVPEPPAQWLMELLAWLHEEGWRNALAVAAFVLLFKVGDAAMAPMVKPFWLDAGLSVSEVGLISITLGTTLSILGALVGGELTTRLGTFRALWILGALQALSNLGYAAAATWQGRPEVYAASMVESFTGGLGTAAFLAALMALTRGKQATTRFALLSALMGLSRTISGAVSGYGAQHLGYAAYFAFTFALALPAFGLLPAMRRRLLG